ncbi:hypothetical protein COCMIDRAFT_85990 [Bipolaris oryzae ATCC 44560]|uniref:Uncharacterized protein n=1 Tax=Bipolaris oryzae ATCC 44560 TaxID=930090 RepID=W6ZAY0_COCMI|nr:uncharacterized protein COCMIDRAFT_85990 [Bipolaris oryzae ATCC 44560]EUC48927.1 hypothetical protein COCMIDRAFT_85990 [Bipolaris oryzae ATCC 44560]
MSQRNPNDMCPRGQRHSHQQCSAQCQLSSDTEPVLDVSKSQNQLQHTHTESTDATCIAPTTNSQLYSSHLSYRQSIPYWDDFNGIIYEIPYGKLLSPSKAHSQQAGGRRNTEPQNSCAEIAGDGPHGENKASHTVLSHLGTSQENMPDGENEKSLGLAPYVDAEETQNKGCLVGLKKDGVYTRESIERTSSNK